MRPSNRESNVAASAEEAERGVEFDEVGGVEGRGKLRRHREV